MLPQLPQPVGYRFGDLQLELSLKPFFDSSSTTREAVCREIFAQWSALGRHTESISILLWVAEGSEILEYGGDLEASFEWARYHGAPNAHQWELPATQTSGDPDHNAIGVAAGPRDPEQKGIHRHAYLYRPNPGVFTYGWLRDLVDDLKRIGAEMTGKRILVGQAFDIGPEFAKSRFKFEWHREILGDGPIFKEQFISCEAVLAADDRCYAAYPEGIPAGTRIGEFLGRQCRQLFDDCGQDFIWLSNGFGFALEPWAMVGQIFDGEQFHPERAAGTADRIMCFWHDLRAALGAHTPIRCRGTNLATGIDLGSDASPFKRIYEEISGVEEPVNSPWAALDGDFGLELSGWMSHLAGCLAEDFRFRFYLHDPWWLNSPWFDRYGRRPHDLFLPLSVSRLRENGQVQIPRNLAFLSIDDSHGKMPLAGPNEVTAHLLRARETAPDDLGPLVWVYPLDEYNQLVLEEGAPDRALHADSWIGMVINAGVPLNTVADADILGKVLRARPESLAGRLFFVAVPRPGSAYEMTVRALIETGADVLLYGPLFPDSFLWEDLGLAPGPSLDGDFRLKGLPEGASDRIRHLGVLSAGGWSETVRTGNTADNSMVLEAQGEGGDRVALVVRKTASGGRLGWLRASVATGEFDPAHPAPLRGPILKPLKEPGFLAGGALARIALQHFGWDLDPEDVSFATNGPYLTIHSHRNGMVLSGYHRNEHRARRIRLPLGAPMRIGCHNRMENGATVVSGEVAWQYEVRACIDGMDTGMVACREIVPAMHGVHRRLLVSGLEDATVRVLPDPRYLDQVRMLRDPKFPYFLDERLAPASSLEQGHHVLTVEHVNGELLIEW